MRLRGVIEEFPADVDADIVAIRVAETLGVGAPEVGRLPVHWVRSALVLREAEVIVQERQAKRAQKKKP